MNNCALSMTLRRECRAMNVRQHPLHREQQRRWHAMRASIRFAVADNQDTGLLIPRKRQDVGTAHERAWPVVPRSRRNVRCPESGAGDAIAGKTLYTVRNRDTEPPDTIRPMAGAGSGSRNRPANDGVGGVKTSCTVSHPILSGQHLTQSGLVSVCPRAVDGGVRRL